MRLFRWCFVLALLLASDVALLHAQRGGITIGRGSRGGGGRMGMPSAPAMDDVADVAKAILKDIKRSKPQGDTLKLVDKVYKEQEKELIKVDRSIPAAMGTGRGRGRAGGPSPELRTAIADLHTEYIGAVREILDEEQRKTFDLNVAAYRKKLQDARQARGRGRGAGDG